MKTLVTGGCGFIGSNFINYLFNKTAFNGIVINIDKLTYAGNPENLKNISNKYSNNRYFFECIDIANYDELDKVFVKYSPEIIVHFATESHVDSSKIGQ